MRAPAQMETLEDRLFSKTWRLPFATGRQMACYGALQEVATFLAYKAQRENAQAEGDLVLATIFGFISRDEAAHAGFYRRLVGLELEKDRDGTLADLGLVISKFDMPGAGLIPEYKERLRCAGGGISPRHFLERGIIPMLKTLGTSRDELRRVLRHDRTEAVQQQ